MRGRRRFRDPRRAGWAALLAAAACAASAPGAPAAAAPAGTGSFTLSGALSGRIAVAGCTAARRADDIQFAWDGGVHSLRGVSAKSTVTIELDLTHGPGYGRSGSFRPSATWAPPFVSLGATNPNPLKLALSWQSVFGSYTTAARGASGSVHASLTPISGGGHLTLTGSWKGCAVAA